MSTRTDTGPDPADLAGLNPEDYRDACVNCMSQPQTDVAAYTAAPVKMRPRRGGFVARYRHTCGHTWVCGWTLPTT